MDSLTKLIIALVCFAGLGVIVFIIALFSLVFNALEAIFY